MMKMLAAFTAGFLALGGCGGGKDNSAASAGESAAPTSDEGEATSAGDTAASAVEPEPSAVDPSRTDLGAFTVMVPASWQSQPPSTSMRKAQWQIPGDTQLVVYYFGTGGAGGIEANLARWMGQFEQPDGTPSKDRAKITNNEVGGLAITTVDLAGTYLHKARPMATKVTKKPKWRMLAAIVETDSGPYYFKLLGPAAGVQAAAADFAAMIGSIKPSS